MDQDDKPFDESGEHHFTLREILPNTEEEFAVTTFEAPMNAVKNDGIILDFNEKGNDY